MRTLLLALGFAAAAVIPTAGIAQQTQVPAYVDAQMWTGAPQDVAGRIEWLAERIRTGIADGTLSGREGRRALRDLSVLRQQERNMSHRNGELAPRAAAKMQARLDKVMASLNWSTMPAYSPG